MSWTRVSVPGLDGVGGFLSSMAAPDDRKTGSQRKEVPPPLPSHSRLPHTPKIAILPISNIS